MRSVVLRGAMLALIAIMAVSAFAQGGRGQGRFGPPSDWSLLTRKDVSTELKLSEDQKTKIAAAQESQQGSFGSFRDMSEEERVKARAKMQEDQKKVYEAILNKEQLGRLQEIAIQLVGNRAVLRPEVQKELALTDEQKAKIKDLQAKQQEAQAALREKMMNQEIEREEMQTITQKNNEAMGVELGKLLTTEQADKLKKLGGAPFKADPNERIR